MALQSMLAKLEGEEDVSPAQAPATPAIPANQNISLPNSSPFRDDIAPLGRNFLSTLFCWSASASCVR